MELGSWNIEINANKTFTLSNIKYGLIFENASPLIKSDCSFFDIEDCDLDFNESGNSLKYQTRNWQLTLSFSILKNEHLNLDCSVRNRSGQGIKIDKISPLAADRIKSDSKIDRVLINGENMCAYSAMMYDPGEFISSFVIGLANASGDIAAVLGFENPEDAFYDLNLIRTEREIEKFSAVCSRENITLEASQEIAVSPLIISVGASLSGLMEEFSQTVSVNMGHRSQKTVTGWCSWYYYYDQADENDIWENIDAIKDSRLSDKIEFIQIDDGWNLPSRKHPRIWGDWHPEGLFKNGMKDLAQRIKQAGFTPGLWLAPFSVDKASQLFKNHSDWLIKDENDKPLSYWDIYALDLSHPEVLDFVRQTFDRIFNEWGYDYVKIDFLLHAVIKGKRYNNTKTTAQFLREGLQIIRDIAGNRFVLCCGCPMSPAIGICDGMRIGNDVSSRWDVRVNTAEWPAGNLSILSAAVHTVWRHWMHNTFWQNDPDCIITRDYGTKPEKMLFERIYPDFLNDPPYGLTLEEAKCWAQLVWFTGGMALFSENYRELAADRIEILETCFEPNSNPVRWVDWYNDKNVAVFETLRGRKKIGVFNLSDEPVTVRLPSDKIGSQDRWSFRERLSGEKFSGQGSYIEFPTLPRHAGRIWIAE